MKFAKRESAQQVEEGSGLTQRSDEKALFPCVSQRADTSEALEFAQNEYGSIVAIFGFGRTHALR